jgi:hypothetical protein
VQPTLPPVSPIQVSAGGTANLLQFQFIDVGSNIACTVKTAPNGRYNVILSLQNRCVLDKPATLGTGANASAGSSQLSIQQFDPSEGWRIANRNQFVSASDKGSGDLAKSTSPSPWRNKSGSYGSFSKLA